MSQPIFSTSSFTDWCEQQGNKEYHYVDPVNCAIRQYFKAEGVPVWLVSPTHWAASFGEFMLFPKAVRN